MFYYIAGKLYARAFSRNTELHKLLVCRCGKSKTVVIESVVKRAVHEKIYISEDNMLDKMRYICKGKAEPIPELYKQFNKDTRDGRNMTEFSKLLGDAIASIIEVKEECDIDSFLSGNQISFLSNEIKGLDDFELICFLVVK